MAKGGTRPGAGRPKGKKEAATLEKEAMLKVIRQRIIQNSDALFNAAKSAAIGNQYLYKIETKYDGKRKYKTEPILVEDEWEIRDYINQLTRDDRGNEPYGDDPIYYFISTREPNTRAIKDLWDRAFGKVTEKVDVTSGGEKLPTPILAQFVKAKDDAISIHNSDQKDNPAQ